MGEKNAPTPTACPTCGCNRHPPPHSHPHAVEGDGRISKTVCATCDQGYDVDTAAVGFGERIQTNWVAAERAKFKWFLHKLL